VPYTLGNPSYKGSVFKDIGLFGGDPNLPAVTSGRDARRRQDQVRPDRAGRGRDRDRLLGQARPAGRLHGRDRLLRPARAYRQLPDPAKLPRRRLPRRQERPGPDQLRRDRQGHRDRPDLRPDLRGHRSLVESEKILPVNPPDKLKGDIRLTAVDLSIDAVGNINDDTTTPVTPAGKRNANKGVKAAAKSTPAVTTPVRNRPAIELPKRAPAR